jgi:uncharacterized LabA/DUF88 family protein
LQLAHADFLYKPKKSIIMKSTDFLRIGIFYDGTYFTKAQNYFWGQRKEWLTFKEFHNLLEKYVGSKLQGHADYKVVYSAWFQGLHKHNEATEDNLRKDRKMHIDLLHAGIELKNFLMAEQTKKEKGIDVYMALETLQVGLDNKIDIAILVTGDGDFVPLVRALMKNGVRVLIAYFKYEESDHKSYANERLINSANYSIDINGLENDRDFKTDFKTMFRKAEDAKKRN